MIDPGISELSVRTLDSWHEVGPVKPQDFLFTSSRVFILIHGYNNTVDQAKESYETFLGRLKRFGPVGGQVIGFHWPGNAPWSLLSFGSYPLELHPAVESGKVLAQFLHTVQGPRGMPIEIILVCHSLGNRVAIELL